MVVVYIIVASTMLVAYMIVAYIYNVVCWLLMEIAYISNPTCKLLKCECHLDTL